MHNALSNSDEGSDVSAFCICSTAIFVYVGSSSRKKLVPYSVPSKAREGFSLLLILLETHTNTLLSHWLREDEAVTEAGEAVAPRVPHHPAHHPRLHISPAPGTHGASVNKNSTLVIIAKKN